VRRYRKYRAYRNRGSERARAHIAARYELSREFGGIDREIEQFFLALQPNVLDSLLREYGEKYGVKAEVYARETYPKWRSGTVKMSGQTALRLLNLIPPHLPDERRYELFKKLRAHHIERTTITVRTDLHTWREQVEPAVASVVDRARYHNLPRRVLAKAKWLASGDMESYNRLLGRVEEEDAKLRIRLLSEELERIRYLIDSTEGKRTVRHTIRLPYGDVLVEIVGPRRGFFARFTSQPARGANMNKKDNALIRLDHEGKSVARPSENVLDAALADLTSDERARLKAKVIEERIRLDATAKEAEQRFLNSTRDMSNTLKLSQEMDRNVASDYEIRSRFETASGTTDVHIKRSKNLATIVVVVVIGIVLLVLLLR